MNLGYSIAKILLVLLAGHESECFFRLVGEKESYCCVGNYTTTYEESSAGGQVAVGSLVPVFSDGPGRLRAVDARLTARESWFIRLGRGLPSIVRAGS